MISSVLQRHECEVIVEPGQAERLADLLRSLSENPCQLIAMGRRAHQMLDAHFTRRHAFERWSGLLEQIGRLSYRKAPADMGRSEPSRSSSYLEAIWLRRFQIPRTRHADWKA